MTDSIEIAIKSSLIKLFTPLIRILLRYSISYGVFVDLAKQVYVQVAQEDEFQLPGRKQTNARISVLTGLTRKEVLRIKRLPSIENQDFNPRYDRTVRVISAWNRENEFTNSKGRPVSLPLEGLAGSFSSLVRQYSGDMSVYAVLDELQRINAVERLKNGKLKLRMSAFVPKGQVVDKIAILGTDSADLMNTIDHNLQNEMNDSRFQLKVCYNNLSEDSVREFEHLSSSKSLALLKEFDRWLAKKDRGPDSELTDEEQFRVGVGIYYFQDHLEKSEKESLP